MQSLKTQRHRQRHRQRRLFAFTFFVTSSYILCRIVADAVLLTRIGTAALPPMLVFSALMVGSISFLWSRRTKELPLHGLVLSTQVSGAAATAVLLVLLRLWPQSMAIVCGIFVLAELRGCLNAIQLAVLLNETFCNRREQQKFAVVNAAAPVAGIVVGSILGANADTVEPTLLLGCACVLDVFAILMIRSTTAGQRVGDPVRKLRTHALPTVLLTTPGRRSDAAAPTRTFAKAILWIVVCKTIVLAIVAFEWKVLASEMFPADERALAAYFGVFYAVSDALILFTQLFVTRFLLQYVGVAGCIAVLPLYLLLLGTLLLGTRNSVLLFGLITAARGSMVIRWSIDDVALQILYGTLPEIVRRGTVARILGIAKPLAEAGTAAGIGILVWYLSVRTLTWLWLPVLGIWLCWTVKVSAEWSRLTGPESN